MIDFINLFPTVFRTGYSKFWIFCYLCVSSVFVLLFLFVFCWCCRGRGMVWIWSNLMWSDPVWFSSIWLILPEYFASMFCVICFAFNYLFIIATSFDYKLIWFKLLWCNFISLVLVSVFLICVNKQRVHCLVVPFAAAKRYAVHQGVWPKAIQQSVWP